LLCCIAIIWDDRFLFGAPPHKNTSIAEFELRSIKYCSYKFIRRLPTAAVARPAPPASPHAAASGASVTGARLGGPPVPPGHWQRPCFVRQPGRGPQPSESRVRVRPQPTTADRGRRATGPAGLAARGRKRRVSDGSAPGRTAGAAGGRAAPRTRAGRGRPSRATAPGGPPVPPTAVLHSPTTAVALPAPPDWPTENASVASVTVAQYRARCASGEIRVARARHGRFKFENLTNLDPRLRKS
jgi:hypothetical protein